MSKTLRALMLWLVALASFVVMTADAAMYKWTDEKGRVHYSSEPPPGGQAESFSGRNAPVTGSTTTFNRKKVEPFDVSRIRDKCDVNVTAKRAAEPIRKRDILGKWTLRESSDCLDGERKPEKGFPYSWQFMPDGSVKLSLKRTETESFFLLKDNVIYLDGVGKTAMVLIERKGGLMTWAHTVGGSFYAWYYVRRNN